MLQNFGTVLEQFRGKERLKVRDFAYGVVRFLGASEAEGVELLNCSPYIRDWIFRERNTDEQD